MEKYNKKFFFGGILFVSLLVIAAVGAYHYMKEQQNEELNKYMEEQKIRIEKYLKYNYNNVHSVTVTGMHKNPTGVIHIEGYINEDKNLKIDTSIESEKGIEFVDILSVEFYDENKKPELEDKSKSVSEIEAEEKRKSSGENTKETARVSPLDKYNWNNRV
ncbi:DUF1433 domain-containing protein [Bacillus nitratireducens]|uniref:DUF1433 domain-containing protein n=1 Tax=Bacillus nitratireducens TaxID=2026193 RepID=UPI000BED694E|nr:DUF1433 domain-containing protein [Bacillus nitratireducens]PEA28817.1 hypothetical protein CON44_02490 [Bacillus cereus]PFK15674.1 hypothetical protein COJ05_25175 [Bacillus cereus]PFP59502.1 hypothetical protein COK09_13405 [Bacillus cereus]PFV24005.1 hypothetical protein COK97_07895 [Bacillus cereus]PGK72449.1 hypothetical protein CN924_25620 [Bacillus cereus]